MSLEAPNWYTIQYDQRVRHLLQSEGFLLRGTTDAPVEVKGNTLEFFFIGRGEAQPFGATPKRGKAANLGKTKKTVDMTDWQFYEEVRHGEPDKISPEYRSKIQQAGSMALGRKFDRIIMEAMDGEAGNITTIGDGSVAITPPQASTGKAQINSLGMMSMNEFYLPVHVHDRDYGDRHGTDRRGVDGHQARRRKAIQVATAFAGTIELLPSIETESTGDFQDGTTKVL